MNDVYFLHKGDLGDLRANARYQNGTKINIFEHWTFVYFVTVIAAVVVWRSINQYVGDIRMPQIVNKVYATL